MEKINLFKEKFIKAFRISFEYGAYTTMAVIAIYLIFFT